jgi:hypothetical protein
MYIGIQRAEVNGGPAVQATKGCVPDSGHRQGQPVQGWHGENQWCIPSITERYTVSNTRIHKASKLQHPIESSTVQ